MKIYFWKENTTLILINYSLDSIYEIKRRNVTKMNSMYLSVVLWTLLGIHRMTSKLIYQNKIYDINDIIII